ncbi:MAG: Na+:solute symporter [Pirellulales bacterium]|nr:Na+:solute symporter [Pirellulales bacterium]
MHAIDFGILIGFMLWMLVIGWIFSGRMKDASEMFAAGGQSPWWISGLSGFMTIFSAGTFVVWGGIAFRLGMVAVSILVTIGFCMIIVGWSIAGIWRKMGITTPAEFLRIRFDEPVVQVYTWLGTFYRGIGLGVALYALAVMLSVLVPLPEGAPFRDAKTGNLSVNAGILLWGAVVIAYTMAGGLWAVLMTDVIQCLLLCLAVLVAVPLSVAAIGGLDELWNRAPSHFFSPAAGEYGYTFLFLWIWVNVFRFGADWAFVQRFICVPTPRDARKVAYLMGVLYIVSPFLWMLPAMAYRILEPGADPKEAYMLMCRLVLPAGVLGIMVAAMFSATASMVSSLLNVFAGVFTCDVYQALIHPTASARRLVLVGRLATLGYGIVIILIALSVPYLGGAEDLVIVLMTSMLGPLMMPTIWALYSRHVGPWCVWATLIVCTPATMLVKAAPTLCEKTAHWGLPSVIGAAVGWIEANPRLTDAILGLLLPLAVLIVIEILCRRGPIDDGWNRMQAAIDECRERPPVAVESRLPARVVAVSLGILTLLMFGITACATRQQSTLMVFSVLLLVVTGVLSWMGFRPCKHRD